MYRNDPTFSEDRSEQTVQTHIRLLLLFLEEQSHQGLHYLPSASFKCTSLW